MCEIIQTATSIINTLCTMVPVFGCSRLKMEVVPKRIIKTHNTPRSIDINFINATSDDYYIQCIELYVCCSAGKTSFFAYSPTPLSTLKLCVSESRNDIKIKVPAKDNYKVNISLDSMDKASNGFRMIEMLSKSEKYSITFKAITTSGEKIRQIKIKMLDVKNG